MGHRGTHQNSYMMSNLSNIGGLVVLLESGSVFFSEDITLLAVCKGHIPKGPLPAFCSFFLGGGLPSEIGRERDSSSSPRLLPMRARLG